MGLLGALFGSIGGKKKNIEWAISNLAREGSIMGTAYNGISYNDVVSYIKENGCKVLKVTKKPRGDWIEFETTFDGKKHIVALDKTFEGNGSVLSARYA